MKLQSFLGLIFFSCVSCTETPPKAPIEPITTNQESAPASVARKPTPPKEKVCLALEDSSGPLPIWIKDCNVVVTRFLNECTESLGRSGYKPDSSWVAMGFPCSGGGGRVDIGGHYYAPKIVSFVVSTDCAMAPQNINEVSEIGRQALQLEDRARLMAYNPFAVQFWELIGYEDADVGFSIDLRSTKAKQELWPKFLGKSPIAVRLYGRENAWVQGYHFFEVEALLSLAGPEQFKIEITTVKALDKEAMSVVKSRCEVLHPRRDCSSVFR